jgi:hypothetical protein
MAVKNSTLNQHNCSAFFSGLLQNSTTSTYDYYGVMSDAMNDDSYFENRTLHKCQQVTFDGNAFPKDFVEWMNRSRAVISGSFVTALAMSYIGAVPFVPGDIDVFCYPTSEEDLKNLPGIDKGTVDVHTYDFNLGLEEHTYYAKIIYIREIIVAGVSMTVQIICFSNDNSGPGASIENDVSDYMDFTVASSTLTVNVRNAGQKNEHLSNDAAPGVFMFTMRIPHMQDLLDRKLCMNFNGYEPRTHTLRIEKWTNRGFSGTISPKCIDFTRSSNDSNNRAINPIGPIASEYFAGLSSRVLLVKACSRRHVPSKILACKDVTVTLNESIDHLVLDASSGRITGRTEKLLRITAYSCNLEIDIEGPYMISHHISPEYVSYWFQQIPQADRKITFGGASANYIVELDDEFYHTPHKSPAGYWVVDYPRTSMSDDSHEIVKFYAEHHHEVYDGACGKPCSYEETDAWCWKSPDYLARNAFGLIQLQYWAVPFLRHYNYSKFACDHIFRSVSDLHYYDLKQDWHIPDRIVGDRTFVIATIEKLLATIKVHDDINSWNTVLVSRTADPSVRLVSAFKKLFDALFPNKECQKLDTLMQMFKYGGVKYNGDISAHLQVTDDDILIKSNHSVFTPQGHSILASLVQTPDVITGDFLSHIRQAFGFRKKKEWNDVKITNCCSTCGHALQSKRKPLVSSDDSD